jgi:hypothetical protein
VTDSEKHLSGAFEKREQRVWVLKIHNDVSPSSAHPRRRTYIGAAANLGQKGEGGQKGSSAVAWTRDGPVADGGSSWMRLGDSSLKSNGEMHL